MLIAYLTFFFIETLEWITKFVVHPVPEGQRAALSLCIQYTLHAVMRSWQPLITVYFLPGLAYCNSVTVFSSCFNVFLMVNKNKTSCLRSVPLIGRVS